MATVKYLIRSKKNNANIYVRFVNGRAYNLTTVLPVCINSKFWDQDNQKIRNVLEVKNRDSINRKLAHLKLFIPDEFNNAFMEGEVIDTSWLNKTCRNFFNRPKQEKKGKLGNEKIYYTDFANWWIENKAGQWLVNSSSYLSQREQDKYSAFIKMVERFEKRDKLRLKDITARTISDFVKSLAEQHYSSKTIQRHVSRFKFFLNRAEELNLSVNPAFKQKVFTPKAEPLKKPYLNQKEIEKIFNHDFSDNETLDNVRDNLIIGCWTGLRVSDFLGQLDISNFIDDTIEIRTTKTKTNVVIPLHPMVKKILLKRNGKLPKKITDQRFNVYVKDVCEDVGIKEEMKGSLYSKDDKRKIVGTYPKYKLISSHVGRRSFCTNLIGKIDDQTIMAVAGWSTKSMMYKYVQTSNKEYSDKLKAYWDAELTKNE